MKEWTHEELLNDLQNSLTNTFKNVPLGSVWAGHYIRESFKKEGQEVRAVQFADLIQVKPSFTKFMLTIYEVKSVRSNFLMEKRSEKYRGYFQHCHRLYFAVPVGIIKLEEMPEDVGLMVRGDVGWKVMKAAKVFDSAIPQETLLSMVFLRSKLPRRDKTLIRESYNHSERAKKFGETMSSAYELVKSFPDIERLLSSNGGREKLGQAIKFIMERGDWRGYV